MADEADGHADEQADAPTDDHEHGHHEHGDRGTAARGTAGVRGADGHAAPGGPSTGGDGRRGVAVVTGASAGVGRAVAVGLANAGFDVALVARGRAGLEAAAKEVEGAGRRAVVVPTDVAAYEEVAEAGERAERELGPVDVWVNDAMTTIFAPSWDVEPRDFRRAVEVTFLGQVWGTRVALSSMMPRDRGTVVNVGSALAFVGIPLQSAYCSSKFACRGFFESVRAELLHTGSHVQLAMVHLPGVNTTQFNWCKSVFDRHPQPVPPIYQPEVAAKAIVAAALDPRRAKVLGAWNKILVAAARAFPGFATQYAALAAWGSQLSDRPASPDRPFNLWDPLDASSDHGAHGIFDDEARGVLDRHFVESLPSNARKLAVAAARTVREKTARHRAAT